mgnify:CR=1 FL=1
MKTLLYGGTFDPPHNGHLNNLRAAAARVRPDRVVVMPAGLSPFKQSTAAPGSARLAGATAGFTAAYRMITSGSGKPLKVLA